MTAGLLASRHRESEFESEGNPARDSIRSEFALDRQKIEADIFKGAEGRGKIAIYPRRFRVTDVEKLLGAATTAVLESIETDTRICRRKGQRQLMTGRGCSYPNTEIVNIHLGARGITVVGAYANPAELSRIRRRKGNHQLPQNVVEFLNPVGKERVIF